MTIHEVQHNNSSGIFLLLLPYTIIPLLPTYKKKNWGGSWSHTFFWSIPNGGSTPALDISSITFYLQVFFQIYFGHWKLLV